MFVLGWLEWPVKPGRQQEATGETPGTVRVRPPKASAGTW
jgi:hypothetical protein